MTFHRLVDIQAVHTGCVEAGEPHVTHDYQLERVVLVSHAFSESLTLRFGGVVLGNFRAVARFGGHDDLDRAFGKVVVVPVGAELDDGGVEFGSDAARHADHHAFTGKDFLTGLKVGLLA